MSALPDTAADWLGDIRPPGSCKHRPTSNGWSESTSQPRYSWCGYCLAYTEHDDEWAAKFSARALRLTT